MRAWTPALPGKPPIPDPEARIAEFREEFRRVRAEVAKVLVGQDEVHGVECACCSGADGRR
jgi:hypothetical protein